MIGWVTHIGASGRERCIARPTRSVAVEVGGTAEERLVGRGAGFHRGGWHVHRVLSQYRRVDSLW